MAIGRRWRTVVIFDISGAGLATGEFERRIGEHGVRMGADGSSGVIRAVTHLDVTREDCERAIKVVREACR